MTIEDRLRRAIEARTSSVEPNPDGYDRIAEKLLDEGKAVDVRGQGPHTRWILAAAAAFMVVVAGVGSLALLSDDDDNSNIDTVNQPDSTDISTTTTTGPSTSASPPTSQGSGPTPSSATPPSGGTAVTDPTTPGGAPDVALQQVVWPRPSSTVRFSDPIAAVNSFVRYYAHFRDPVVGEFRPGDNRSGEVPVGSATTSLATTVLVRQLSDDKWYVIGSLNEDITLHTPGAGAQLSCPQHVAGLALAFEAQVEVRIDAYQPDGDRVEIGRDYVMGSGSPPPGPFSGDVACTVPAGVEDYGVLTLWTDSQDGDGGGTVEIVSIPIRLRN